MNQHRVTARRLLSRRDDPLTLAATTLGLIFLVAGLVAAASGRSASLVVPLLAAATCLAGCAHRRRSGRIAAAPRGTTPRP